MVFSTRRVLFHPRLIQEGGVEMISIIVRPEADLRGLFSLYRDSVVHYNFDGDISVEDQYLEGLEVGRVAVYFLALWEVPCTARISADVHEGLIRLGGEICLFGEGAGSVIQKSLASVETGLNNFSLRRPHSSFSITYIQEFSTHLEEEIGEEAL